MTYPTACLPREHFAPLIATDDATPGEADAPIHALFTDPAAVYIHAHIAPKGCFAARIDRHGEHDR